MSKSKANYYRLVIKLGFCAPDPGIAKEIIDECLLTMAAQLPIPISIEMHLEEPNEKIKAGKA